MVVIVDIISSDNSIGDVAVADPAGVEGGTVVAFIQVALLTLTGCDVHEPVVLLVAFVAEGHVVTDQTIFY